MKQIPDERIQDLLCCALEGGSNYWYLITAFNYPKGQTKESLGIEFQHLELPFRGGSITVADAEDPSVVRILDREAIARGLTAMEEKRPREWADFIGENEDAETGDVFLQLCLFGEVVYG